MSAQPGSDAHGDVVRREDDATPRAPTAVELLHSGMALVRVPRGEKGPIEKGWNRPDRVVRGAVGAARLRGANIGLAHAYCKPCPTAAIDIDDCRAAKRWFHDRGVDLLKLLFAPDAVVIWSGTDNRIKLLYRLPAGQAALVSRTIKGPIGKMLLEFRCATSTGLTLQDLLPPSVHPSGRVYQWMGAGDPLAIPEMPREVLEIWRGLLIAQLDRAELSRQHRQQLHAARDETPREVATMRDRLRYISADCDRAEWRDIVWALLSTRWKCAEEMAREWSMTAPHRFSDDAMENVIRSYETDRVRAHTVGTIIFYARKGGWNG